MNQGVRLACVRHAASVYPEPGSNSPSKDVSNTAVCLTSVKCANGDAIQAKFCFAWLVRRCFSVARGYLLQFQLTGTVCLLGTTCPNSCCSAFHSSVVKVLNPTYKRLLVFRCLRSVAVVSHRSCLLSRGFSLFFCLLVQFPVAFFRATGSCSSQPGASRLQKRFSSVDRSDSCSIAYPL